MDFKSIAASLKALGYTPRKADAKIAHCSIFAVASILRYWAGIFGCAYLRTRICLKGEFSTSEYDSAEYSRTRHFSGGWRIQIMHGWTNPLILLSGLCLDFFRTLGAGVENNFQFHELHCVPKVLTSAT